MVAYVGDSVSLLEQLGHHFQQLAGILFGVVYEAYALVSQAR